MVLIGISYALENKTWIHWLDQELQLSAHQVRIIPLFGDRDTVDDALAES